MTDKDEKDSPGIRVVDRRRFDAEGAAKDDATDSDDDRQEHRAREPDHEMRTAEEASAPSSHQPIDFISFIASLATNAFAALGALNDDAAQELPRDPALAREYIDILALLEDKTRGNLTEQETQVLTQLLSDLRLAYVELAGKIR